MKKILLVTILLFLGACSQSGIVESSEYTNSPAEGIPVENTIARIIPGETFRIGEMYVYYSTLYFEIVNETSYMLPPFYADYTLICDYAMYKSGSFYSPTMWEFDSESHTLYLDSNASSCRLTITELRLSEYGSVIWRGSYSASTTSSWW